MSAHKIIVVGGGVAGLSTAHFLKELRPELEVRVVEKEAEPGGKMRSSRVQGYLVDWGPNGFLSNVPETLELARALGLALEPAAEAAKHRLLYKDGALRRLPASPLALLRSELLSPVAKLRALGDLFARPHEGEETVHAFVARHFGEEVATTLAGPLVLGITAGDACKVSVDALFPRLRALERQGGSLVRALLRAQRARKREPTLPGAPDGRLTSFAGGVQTLTDALQRRLGAALQTGTGVAAMARAARAYRLTLESGETLEADAVVLATPAFVSAALLEPLAPEPARTLSSIPYADVVVYGLGYARVDVPRTLDGFGFLVARGEGLRILGVLYSSSIFPAQAPKGCVLLRVIAGGSVDPGFSALAEDEALVAVRSDLALSMGVHAEPEMVERATWPRGIPQYELGHPAKVARIIEGLATEAIFLTGNAYYGVGVNDCVREARRTADGLLARLDGAARA